MSSTRARCLDTAEYLTEQSTALIQPLASEIITTGRLS